MESTVARTESIVSHFRFKESDTVVSIQKKSQTPQTEESKLRKQKVRQNRSLKKIQKWLYNRRRKEWQSFAKEECEL